MTTHVRWSIYLNQLRKSKLKSDREKEWVRFVQERFRGKTATEEFSFLCWSMMCPRHSMNIYGQVDALLCYRAFVPSGQGARFMCELEKRHAYTLSLNRPSRQLGSTVVMTQSGYVDTSYRCVLTGPGALRAAR